MHHDAGNRAGERRQVLGEPSPDVFHRGKIRLWRTDGLLELAETLECRRCRLRRRRRPDLVLEVGEGLLQGQSLLLAELGRRSDVLSLGNVLAHRHLAGDRPRDGRTDVITGSLTAHADSLLLVLARLATASSAVPRAIDPSPAAPRATISAPVNGRAAWHRSSNGSPQSARLASFGVTRAPLTWGSTRPPV